MRTSAGGTLSGSARTGWALRSSTPSQMQSRSAHERTATGRGSASRALSTDRRIEVPVEVEDGVEAGELEDAAGGGPGLHDAKLPVSLTKPAEHADDCAEGRGVHEGDAAEVDHD